MMESLPEELKAEIVKRLTNKELLRCTAVCKSWYSLIKSPSFIYDTHLPHLQTSSSSNSNSQFVLVSRILRNGKSVMSFHDDDTEEFTESHLPPRFYSMSHLTPYASCNGLLLFRQCEFILWNPSICRSLFLPKPKLDIMDCELLCLGFDYSTNDFKVLRLLYNLCDFEEPTPFVAAEIYSLNAASWKNLSHITPQYYIPDHIRLNHRNTTFVNGAFHMIARDCSSNDKGRNLMFIFDVKYEIFREILLPQCLQNVPPVDLFVIAYGQSVAVVHLGYRIESDIWVMKEYGVFHSWTNLANMFSVKTRSAVFFVRKNGQLMMDSGIGDILSFDFATQRLHNLFTGLSALCLSSAFTYTESLALLDRGNLIVEPSQASCRI